MKKILIFLGPPGSGKGTQAKRIAEKHNYGHISTGDLLRALKADAAKAPDEAEALAEMEQGKLVPDWLIYRLAFRAIDSYLAKGQGVVLDGAIRTVEQAEEFQKYFAAKGLENEMMAVDIAISDDESLKRLTSRRVCSRCGAIIPVSVGTGRDLSLRQDRCPKCGGDLIIRADDNPDIIKERIAEQGNTALAPIREYYQKFGVLKTVDGMKSIEEVEKIIEKLLSAKGGSASG